MNAARQLMSVPPKASGYVAFCATTSLRQSLWMYTHQGIAGGYAGTYLRVPVFTAH
jgi:hypothetical protein